GGGGNLIHCGAYFGEGREDGEGLGVAARPVATPAAAVAVAVAAGLRRIARIGELRPAVLQFEFPGYCHEWRPPHARTKCRLQVILVSVRGLSLSIRSRFGGAAPLQ